jgi:hypothetical protein
MNSQHQQLGLTHTWLRLLLLLLFSQEAEQSLQVVRYPGLGWRVLHLRKGITLCCCYCCCLITCCVGL